MTAGLTCEVCGERISWSCDVHPGICCNCFEEEAYASDFEDDPMRGLPEVERDEAEDR